MGIEILDVCLISPPPGSVPTTSIPLAFLDLPWLGFHPIQRLFFYDFPHPSSHFTQNLLPLFKHTLSLTLQHFFPYAASLVCPPPPHKPYLSYIDGDNSVSFTVAESSGDFHCVITNHAHDVTLLHPFVPKLSSERVTPDGTRVSPLLALQITLFPNVGICIGTTYDHAAADGSVLMKFINSWASLYRSGGESSLSALDKKSIPCCNREGIQDQIGMEPILLNDYWKTMESSLTDQDGSGPPHTVIEDKVRATFVISPGHVESLKHLVTTFQSKNMIGLENSHVSTFVVTCAFMWVCWVKMMSLFSVEDTTTSSIEFSYFVFSFDCRKIFALSGSETYFGNCLTPGVVKVKRIDLMEGDGIVMAARAIGRKVNEMKAGTMMDIGKWLEQISDVFRTGHRPFSIAGSPKLRVYDTDFGWGRPRKVEVAQIDVDGAMSLAEARDEKGGIELGVALSKSTMDQLIPILQESLELL